jgi:hypothetical protein
MKKANYIIVSITRLDRRTFRSSSVRTDFENVRRYFHMYLLGVIVSRTGKEEVRMSKEKSSKSQTCD